MEQERRKVRVKTKGERDGEARGRRGVQDTPAHGTIFKHTGGARRATSPDVEPGNSCPRPGNERSLGRLLAVCTQRAC